MSKPKWSVELHGECPFPDRYDVIEVAADLEPSGQSAGGAGVQTVSGSAVDNTDPANPVIAIPASTYFEASMYHNEGPETLAQGNQTWHYVTNVQGFTENGGDGSYGLSPYFDTEGRPAVVTMIGSLTIEAAEDAVGEVVASISFGGGVEALSHRWKAGDPARWEFNFTSVIQPADRFMLSLYCPSETGFDLTSTGVHALALFV